MMLCLSKNTVSNEWSHVASVIALFPLSNVLAFQVTYSVLA